MEKMLREKRMRIHREIRKYLEFMVVDVAILVSVKQVECFLDLLKILTAQLPTMVLSSSSSSSILLLLLLLLLGTGIMWLLLLLLLPVLVIVTPSSSSSSLVVTV